jgi:Cd2+/Zn2+-exporting ATPase
VNSEHHLGQAILDFVDNKDELKSPDKFQSITGKGVIVEIEDDEVMVGNNKLLKEKGIDIPEDILNDKNKLNESGKTVVFVTQNDICLGIIGISDPPREDAARTVEKLHEERIKKTIMLTGDEDRIARSIADDLNLDQYQAGLLPEEKVKAIKDLQKEGYTVAMVGDGINDAPSLAAADIGVAMGVAGTDAAIETADIALMADKIDKLPFALGLSKATSRNIKQNIVFAILVVFTLLAGVLGKKCFWLQVCLFMRQVFCLLP